MRNAIEKFFKKLMAEVLADAVDEALNELVTFDLKQELTAEVSEVVRAAIIGHFQNAAADGVAEKVPGKKRGPKPKGAAVTNETEVVESEIIGDDNEVNQ